MSLSTGARFGPYEIVAPLGAGGMGEVYRARDTKLQREVAIKVLPESFALDSQHRARFEREAQVLASLNHPHIAQIHGLEETGDTRALVMELVEGLTLAERIAQAPIPLDEAIAIVKQIAAALEAAHEQGIIHRDLKPANIKVRPDGTVKVLDFGLAKAVETAAASAVNVANSPTLSLHTTQAGMILGTAAYMSPEQARGKPVDRRADIWAFGCVLYEMLVGKPAFSGESVTDILTAVVQRPPDWLVLPNDTPDFVAHLLRRCLHKDAKQRLRDIGEARVALDEARGDAPIATPATRSPTSQIAALTLALLAGAALATAYWRVAAGTTAVQTPLHLSVALEPGVVSFKHLFEDQFAISPDGTRIVYVAPHDGRPHLFLRALDAASGTRIDGTENGLRPFFSPDGQWIAFATGNSIKKVPLTGGASTTLCVLAGGSTAQSNAFVGGAWGAGGQLVFVPRYNGGIWSVPETGGTPQLLLATDASKDRLSYTHPQMLPGNGGVLFTMISGRTVTTDEADIAVLPPGANEPRVLISGGSNARYVPTGHLAYVRGGALLAVPFDVSRLEVTGTPRSVLAGLERNTIGDALFAVADNGTLVYEPASGVISRPRLAVVDRQGKVRSVSEEHSYTGEFSLSPDGRRAAARVTAANDDIWIYEMGSGTPLRLTFEPGDETSPRWTPDGTRVAYGSTTGSLYWKSADGTGVREEIARGELPRHPSSFSPDGKQLAFVEVHPSTQRDIWLLPLDGDRTPRPFQATDADEWGPKISPDGRWMAYVSNETGREEIYVRPFGSGGRQRVSTNGGTSPTWAGRGFELLFLQKPYMAAVSLDAGGRPLAREQRLFDAPEAADLGLEANGLYDVTAAGQRFVMLLAPVYPGPTHYNLVLNFFNELRRLDGRR